MPTAALPTPATPAKARRADTMVWFELPVSNLQQSTAFYERTFGVSLRTDSRFPGLAMFPRIAEDAVTGALVHTPDVQPSRGGTIIYLNCDGDLDGVLSRALAAGGSVVEEVAQLPGNMGFIAQFRDLDGNRVGLHATF